MALRRLNVHVEALHTYYHACLSQYTAQSKQGNERLIMPLVQCTKAYYRTLYLALRFQTRLRHLFSLGRVQQVIDQALDQANPTDQPAAGGKLQGGNAAIFQEPAPTSAPALPQAGLAVLAGQRAETESLYSEGAVKRAYAKLTELGNITGMFSISPDTHVKQAFDWDASQLHQEDAVTLYEKILTFSWDGAPVLDLSFISLFRALDTHRLPGAAVSEVLVPTPCTLYSACLRCARYGRRATH